jgi:hypothetical protein
MRSLLAVVAFSLTAALAMPAVAQMKKEPKTKADCTKMKDMKWDAKTKKCVEK